MYRYIEIDWCWDWEWWDDWYDSMYSNDGALSQNSEKVKHANTQTPNTNKNESQISFFKKPRNLARNLTVGG